MSKNPAGTASASSPQIVTVTGGTGSFGHAVIHHLVSRPEIQEIRVFSRDENKQDAMRQEIRDPRLRYYIGDVRDPASLVDCMSGADVVFHAAALKQVPSCEFFPEQAVMTNVIGSLNVIRAAEANRVQRVVCLSTDKAVQPVNAMGMTKALMEKQAQAYARRHGDRAPVVCCVRYGNVMYSRGSVIPLFVDRLRHNAPLPITDPSMTRFLLPLSEAVELVWLALTEGAGGDTFIRKSAAASVSTLVEALALIFACSPKQEVIGVRHGEKIHETLATAEEMAKAVDLGEYWKIPADPRSLNYASEVAPGSVSHTMAFSSDTARQLNAEELADLLKQLPELKRLL